MHHANLARHVIKASKILGRVPSKTGRPLNSVDPSGYFWRDDNSFSECCPFKVAINIHVLVEDTYDIDPILCCQIHEQMVGVVVYTYWKIEFAAHPALEGLFRQKVKRVI
jgi:hypothetical protein